MRLKTHQPLSKSMFIYFLPANCIVRSLSLQGCVKVTRGYHITSAAQQQPNLGPGPGQLGSSLISDHTTRGLGTPPHLALAPSGPR